MNISIRGNKCIMSLNSRHTTKQLNCHTTKLFCRANVILLPNNKAIKLTTIAEGINCYLKTATIVDYTT